MKHKIKKTLIFKNHLKRDQSQPVLTFKICDLDHEPETNSVEKNHEAKLSINQISRDKIKKKIQ